MSPRLKRLNLEFERIKVRFASWPLLQLTASSGSPPEQYEFTYFVKSVYMSPTGDILEREQHVLEVNLSLGYPRRAPQCKMLTPVFHPNFDDSAVCIGDFWAASEGLEDLVIRIGRMLTYQDYNIKSPLNGLAARWAAEHPERLPVDPREIAPPAPSVVKPTGVSPVAEPPPLPQTNGLRITIVVDPPQPMPIVVTTPPPALPESLQSPAAPPSSDSADRAGLPAENEPAAEAIGPALAEAMPIEVTTPPPALPEPLQPPAAPPSSDSADHAGLRIETQPVAEAIGPAFAEPTPIEVTTPPPALPEPLQPPVGPPSFSSADRAGLPTEIEPAAEAIGLSLIHI